MKRLIAMLLASAVAMGLGACGASDGASSSAPSGTSSSAAQSAASSGASSAANEKLAQIIKITITEQGSSRLPLRRRPPVRLRHSLLRLPLKQANRFPSTRCRRLTRSPHGWRRCKMERANTPIAQLLK